nr:hypothetical protein [Bacteroidia bacterium]
MRLKLLAVLLLTTSVLFAQGTYLPLGSYGMHFIDRLEIKKGQLAEPNQFNTNTRAYQRSKIAEYANSYDTTNLSKQDLFNLQYLKI